MKKIPFFDHNHGLTPLENIQKCDYLKCKFLKVINDSFYSQDPQALFQDEFSPKTENLKMSFLDQNHGFLKNATI